MMSHLANESASAIMRLSHQLSFGLIFSFSSVHCSRHIHGFSSNLHNANNK